MRIAFDGTTLRPGRTGVGYYTEHLLRHLADELSEHDDIVVMSNRPVDTTAPLPARVGTAVSRWRSPRLLWMQASAPRELARLGADVVHFTNGMLPVHVPLPSVVTIHDMSLTLYPRYHPARRVLLNRPLVDLAARRAGAIITVSDSARRDIVQLYGVGADRVHVIHEAAAAEFQPVRNPAAIARVRQAYRLADRFILYVGTIEPRKNLPMLLEAFAARRRAGDLPHQLVCAGPYGWLSRDIDQRIVRLGIADAVRFTGYVPFADLPTLYSAAEMFVFPSMYEGFGLPVIEAMACGVPVVTGRNSSLAEVAGGATYHVEPLEAGALGGAMAAVAADPALRERMSAMGVARAARFSWQRAARETLDVYRQVVADGVRLANRRPERPAPRLRRSPAPAPLVSASPPGPQALQTPVAQAFQTPVAQAFQTPVAQAFQACEPCDVLIGQAYFLRFDPKLWDAQQPYAPLGALYAAACVRERGYRVALFDAMLAESESQWARALDAHAPRVAVIYEDNFNYLSKMCLLRMREAALTMIAAARARGVPIVVAGSDATDNPAIYLEHGAAAVIAGEGEVTLGEAIDAIAGRSVRTLADVQGLCLAGEQGRVIRTGSRPTLRDLDALPLPAWDLVDVGRYRDLWLGRHRYFSMNVTTTRGCPYHCNWCAKPIYGQRYTSRSPESVVHEVAWLKQQYAPDHLWITDDIFGLKPGWIERYAELAAVRGVAVPFKCLLRADQVTGAVASALARAGCRTAWIGAESGSQRILDAMEKGHRVDQIVEATRRLHDAGIEVGFFLQFGYPGETADDIERTLQLVRDCRPDDIGVSVSYPLPGTPFYRRVAAQLGAKRHWVDSDDLAMLYRATYAPEFYRVLHALVHAEFRTRRAKSAALALLRTRPSPSFFAASRFARHAATAAVNAARVPILRRRLSRLAAPAAHVDAAPLPVLTREAAASPSPQSF